MPTFYRPDPNSEQVVDAQNNPLSFEQYKAAGGVGVLGQGPFADVVVGPVPTTPIQTAQPQPTQTTTQPVANPRIDELTKLLFTPPQSSQQLYQDAYGSSGLGEIKTRLADLDKRIAERKSKYTTTEGQVNENPWLSEASRIGKVGRVKDLMEAEIGNLLDEYKQYAKLYSQGLDEINGRLSRETADATNTRSTYQDELNFLLNERDKVENRAYDFTKANNILYPFFKQQGSNQVFDSRTLEPLSYEEYKKRGGVGIQGQDGQYADVQEIQTQSAQEERAMVADLASKYVDAGISLNDTLAVAQAKVQKSAIYQDAVRPPARGGGGGGGGGGRSAGGSTDIDQYADDVFNGRLQLSGVPIKIRSQVSAKVDAMREARYDSEYEARIDYDREIRELEQGIKNGQTPSAKTSEIIQTLVNDYGKYISEQEIAATIRNLLG